MCWYLKEGLVPLIPILAHWWPHCFCLPTPGWRGAHEPLPGRWWAARRSVAYWEVCVFSIQLWSSNYYTSFAMGTVQIKESSGEWETSSDHSNTDAPHHMHHLCGYDRHKLYKISSIPTAPREEWMDACQRTACRDLVPQQTSTSRCLGAARVSARAGRTTFPALRSANSTVWHSVLLRAPQCVGYWSFIGPARFGYTHFGPSSVLGGYLLCHAVRCTGGRTAVISAAKYIEQPRSLYYFDWEVRVSALLRTRGALLVENVPTKQDTG